MKAEALFDYGKGLNLREILSDGEIIVEDAKKLSPDLVKGCSTSLRVRLVP